MFVDEWFVSYDDSYRDFIAKKDLGVTVSYTSSFLIDCSYNIIDIKKWVITRIKYGI